MDEVEDLFGAGADVLFDVEVRIEREFLRQVAGDQIAAADDFAGVGSELAGDDLQERDLPQPLRPTMPTRPFSSMERDALSSTTSSLCRTSRSVAVRIADIAQV